MSARTTSFSKGKPASCTRAQARASTSSRRHDDLAARAAAFARAAARRRPHTATDRAVGVRPARRRRAPSSPRSRRRGRAARLPRHAERDGAGRPAVPAQVHRAAARGPRRPRRGLHEFGGYAAWRALGMPIPPPPPPPPPPPSFSCPTSGRRRAIWRSAPRVARGAARRAARAEERGRARRRGRAQGRARGGLQRRPGVPCARASRAMEVAVRRRPTTPLAAPAPLPAERPAARRGAAARGAAGRRLRPRLGAALRRRDAEPLRWAATTPSATCLSPRTARSSSRCARAAARAVGFKLVLTGAGGRGALRAIEGGGGAAAAARRVARTPFY